MAAHPSDVIHSLGEGGIERWIVYPAVLWLTVFGGALMGTGAPQND